MRHFVLAPTITMANHEDPSCVAITPRSMKRGMTVRTEDKVTIMPGTPLSVLDGFMPALFLRKAGKA